MSKLLFSSNFDVSALVLRFFFLPFALVNGEDDVTEENDEDEDDASEAGEIDLSLLRLPLGVSASMESRGTNSPAASSPLHKELDFNDPKLSGR